MGSGSGGRVAGRFRSDRSEGREGRKEADVGSGAPSARCQVTTGSAKIVLCSNSPPVAVCARVVIIFVLQSVWCTRVKPWTLRLDSRALASFIEL